MKLFTGIPWLLELPVLSIIVGSGWLLVLTGRGYVSCSAA